MRKLILTITLGFISTFSFADSSRSMFMNELPSQCKAQDIIQEIPVTMSNFDVLEILDVTNVETLEKTNSRLTCSAILVTDKGQKRYRITFTQNSMGDIIVNY